MLNLREQVGWNSFYISPPWALLEATRPYKQSSPASISFDWDLSKDRENQKKQGVSFEEAETVFYDEDAKLNREAEILLGLSHRLRILVVRYCYRKDKNVIEITLARKATQNEQKQYRMEKKERDFLKFRRNPYAKVLEKQITSRLEKDVIDTFKKLAQKRGVPYQNLIQLYLKGCVDPNRKSSFKRIP